MFQNAYAIDGGRLPASMLRMLAYIATSGATGIVTPNDLRVSALPTPGGGVQIGPGGAVIATNFSGSTTQQSYAVANDGTVTLNIPATAIAIRTYNVIVRIDDPEYGGQTPANPLEATYCSPEAIMDISNLPYPFVHLARVRMPAETATITEDMITDVRKVAIPRRERHLRTYNLITADGDHYLTNTSNGQNWPFLEISHWTVDIPQWATRANIVATWGGVRVRSSPAAGYTWARIGYSDGINQGGVRTQDQAFDLTNATSNTGWTRETWTNGDDIYIPGSLRGTNQPLRLLGRRIDSNTVTSNAPLLTGTSSIMLDVEFYETAV